MKPGRNFLRIDTTRLRRRSGEYTALMVAAAFFLAGALAGAFAGRTQPTSAETLLPGDGSIYGSTSYAGLLFSCAKYHLAVLLASTSLIGVLLIPAAMALRGFALSCSAAWIVVNYPEGGVALALVLLGLPGLFTVPALFVAAQWGELFSLRLLAAFRRAPALPYRRERDNRATAAVILVFAAAAVEYFLVPPLVRLII